MWIGPDGNRHYFSIVVFKCIDTSCIAGTKQFVPHDKMCK